MSVGVEGQGGGEGRGTANDAMIIMHGMDGGGTAGGKQNFQGYVL